MSACIVVLMSALAVPARSDTTQPAGVEAGDAIHFLADPAHGYEFLASGYSGNIGDTIPDLQVFDAAGTSLHRYTFGPSGGLAIIGDTLYATDFLLQIHRFDLTTDPPTEETALQTGLQLSSLVAAGGTLWASPCLNDSPIESVDPVTGTEVQQDLTGLDISNCPEFADNPALSKVFYVWSRFHGTLYRMDATGGTLTATASWTGSINDVAVAPDGSHVIVGTGAGAVTLNPTTLAETGVTYRDGANVQAVSIASDGHVAVGVGQTVQMFPAGSGTASASWTPGGCLDGSVNVRGLSLGPIETNLFVSSHYGQTVSVLSHATSTLTSSAISSAAQPPAPTPGDTVTVSGTLTIPSGVSSGRTVHLYEAAGTTETSLGSASTDANGAFSFPVSDVSAGSHCFDARFAGTIAATGAAAGTVVTVNKVPSTVSVAGPATSVIPGDQIPLDGVLAFDDAAPPTGATIHIERGLQGSVADWQFDPVGDAIVQPDGSWSYADVAGAVGAYTYRATFDGSDRYLGNSATVDVDVARYASKIQLTSSAGRVVYGKRITLTARIHLADPGANPDITFSIDPARKPVRKLATVQANANGIARYTYVPHGGAKYTATYGGNARNQRASDTVGVMVLWKVRTSLRHNYSKSGQYLLFHQGATPLYLIAVMPAVRVDVKIVLQRWNSGWTTVASGGFNTNKDGGLGVVLNPRGLKIGNRYRLAVVAPNAIINGERMTRTTSSYSYFRITS